MSRSSSSAKLGLITAGICDDGRGLACRSPRFNSQFSQRHGTAHHAVPAHCSGVHRLAIQQDASGGTWSLANAESRKPEWQRETRIFIVDDIPSFAGMKDLIFGTGDCIVCGEAERPDASPMRWALLKSRLPMTGCRRRHVNDGNAWN